LLGYKRVGFSLEVTMLRLLTVLLLLLIAIPAHAAVELARKGDPPVTIKDVYLRDGVSYLAVGDVLSALHLAGSWDDVAHVYRIKTPRGTAIISPGTHYLRLGGQFIPLSHRPRFIDGRLRVAEDFITGHLAALVGQPVFYRNLNPPAVTSAGNDTPLDRLFAFLLRKKKSASAPVLGGVAIDPGHGGQDPGAIGIDGVKEKTVDLAVARQLEKILKMRLGIPVYLSRDGDYTLTRKQRLAAAKHPDVDAFILLHAQDSFSATPHGVTLFVRPREETREGDLPVGEGESMRLALDLKAALQDAGFDVAGILRAPLLPLGRGNLPTVLVELGYLSNPGDEAVLKDPGGQQRLAKALFDGLKSFAKKPKEVAQ
jgi:N-acetylmuramoyl-L-alanine amidase